MPTVLVVDDTHVDRRIAGGLLEDSGAEIRYAENGDDAIRQMEESAPDVVVTDLQMPVMDGLELVTRVRLQFPNVPVILMTAQGSESIAVAALDRGAASYVPKSQLADKLLETVESVIDLSRADLTYDMLTQCQNRIEFSYTLPNDPLLIDTLVDLVQQILGGMELTDHTGKFRTGVALREALLNALHRGNLEIPFEAMQRSREQLVTGGKSDPVSERASQAPYADRRIHVEANITRDEARFTIRDDGPGFDHAKAIAEADFSALGSMDGKKGRGLVLMKTFMDEVTFNEQGNQVTLLKRRDL